VLNTVLRVCLATLMALSLGAAPALAHEDEDDLLSAPEAVALARRIVPPAKNPEGWGKDVYHALERNSIAPRASNFCAVMAVIEQESTFTANPQVKGLGRMAEREIAEKIRSIAILPSAAIQGVNWFLESRPTPDKSYMSLIRAAKTERDLDLVFRNMAFYLFREYATTGLLNTSPVARRVDAVNPVSTLGSMQVSIAFAIAENEREAGKRLQMNAIWKLRDTLYTRAGGVSYGTRMLLGYRANYDSRIYVFADFNAGRYASRNAAFQHMVGALTSETLALDGDLLFYENGKPRPEASSSEKAVRSLKLGLDDKAIRADLLSEKDFAFRDTRTYAAVTRRYAEKTGKRPPYAMLPQIRLVSPKLSRTMTTERFARAVMARYEKCLKLAD
jgi:hypothetical protein